jgi:hypothetical protein
MAQEIVVSIQPTERTVEPRLAESSELLNRMNLSRKCSPAERLRSLKAAEDSTAGDLDDWLRAEKELFHTASLGRRRFGAKH